MVVSHKFFGEAVLCPLACCTLTRQTNSTHGQSTCGQVMHTYNLPYNDTNRPR